MKRLYLTCLFIIFSLGCDYSIDSSSKENLVKMESNLKRSGSGEANKIDPLKFNYKGSEGWWGNSSYLSDNVENRMISGDFDGDGKDDVATFYEYGSSSSRLHVWLSSGSSFTYQFSNGWWASSGYPVNAVASRMVSGDFNGDGKDDIATFFDYGSSNSRIHVWLSTGSSFTYQSSAGWWASAGYPMSAVANRMVSGDFNGDGKDDIATFFDYGSSNSRIHVWLSTGSSFAYQSNAGWWVGTGYSVNAIANRMVSGDFNGDGKDDVATFYNYGGSRSTIHVWLSTGSAFTYQYDNGWYSSDGYIANCVNNRFVTGDFNADGKDDVATFYEYNTNESRIHVWLSTGTSFTYQYDTGWWASAGYPVSAISNRIVAGDFNGNGKVDIATMFKYGSTESRIHVWITSFAKKYLFLTQAYTKQTGSEDDTTLQNNNYLEFGYIKLEENGEIFSCLFNYHVNLNIESKPLDNVFHMPMTGLPDDPGKPEYYFNNGPKCCEDNLLENTCLNRRYELPMHTTKLEKYGEWVWDSNKQRLMIVIDGIVQEWKVDWRQVNVRYETHDSIPFIIKRGTNDTDHRAFYDKETNDSVIRDSYGNKLFEYSSVAGFAYASDIFSPIENSSLKQTDFCEASYKNGDAFKLPKNGDSGPNEELIRASAGGFGIRNFDISQNNPNLLGHTYPAENYKEDGYNHCGVLLNTNFEYDPGTKSIFYYNYGHDFDRNGCYGTKDKGHTTKMWAIFDKNYKVQQILFVQHYHQSDGYPIISIGRYHNNVE